MNLFKIDSLGKIRVLIIENDGPFVKRRAGIYGHTLNNTYKESTPKNIGRANETTPHEQASLEAASEIAEKIRQGYVVVPNASLLTDEEIIQYVKEHSKPIPDCMLAKDFKHAYCKWDEPVLVSKKLDGMRCMAVIEENKVTLYSRGRLEILTMPHIVAELKRLHHETGFTGVLDGELYYHDRTADNFQAIMKACKKYRKGLSEKVEYHIYELIAPNIEAQARYKILSAVLDDFKTLILCKVHQTEVHDMGNLLALHEQNVSEGYEGTMLKHSSGYYREGTRSSQLLKFKDFQDAEYKVLDIVPMDNYPDQGKAVMLCHNTGLTFNATPSISHKERNELLINKHKYIGRMATIKFFSLTEKGVPRIGNLKSFRDE